MIEQVAGANADYGFSSAFAIDSFGGSACYIRLNACLSRVRCVGISHFMRLGLYQVIC
jgi:hypothetical protein